MDCKNGFWQGKVTFGSGINQPFKFDVYGDCQQNFGDNNADKLAVLNGVDILGNNGVGSYQIIFNEKNDSYKRIQNQD
ncbi:MAG: hypothetical protein HRU34_24685 [Richelia sp.]|nr:hypothetical protein [Richelia sp.]